MHYLLSTFVFSLKGIAKLILLILYQNYRLQALLLIVHDVNSQKN